MEIQAPCGGHVIAMRDVSDPVFSEQVVGPGVGIEPTGGRSRVVAPADGVLLKVNPQWKTSFVVCASQAGMSGLTIQGWYASQLNQDNGLWLGSGLNGFSILKAKSGVAPGQQAFPWGYVVTNGKAQRIRFAAEGVEQE